MLETSRLILKVASIEEAPSIMELNADYEVVRFTGDLPTVTIQATEELIKRRFLEQFEKYKMGRFSVYLKDGSYLGWCGLRFVPETSEVDLGFRFKKKYWAQGFATEASEACLKYGFEILKLKRIMAEAMPENTASIKVMQKLKMTFRGFHTNPTDAQGYIRYDISFEEYNKCKK